MQGCGGARLCSNLESLSLGSHPTCHADLIGGTGSAAQHPELLGLVHGVVGTGHHQRVPWLPRAHIGCQCERGAVHISVNCHRECWPH